MEMTVRDTVIVRFSGGLGNQLFEYAFLEWIKTEYPYYNVLADLSYYKLNNPHNALCLWDVFPEVTLKTATLKEMFVTTGLIPSFYGGPLKHKINTIREALNSYFFKASEHTYIYDKDWISPEKAKQIIDNGYNYLVSYWQDVEYYNVVKEKCRKQLTFSVQNVVEYEEDMRKQNAVSMHVRRGDYVNSVFDKEVNLTYYKKAVEYIYSLVDNPHFYIFSDDKEYIKKEFNWISEKTIVEGFDNRKSYIDMYLMSLTPNSIITNSTFSLWAAYLNKKPSNIVYPDVEYMTHKVMKEWIGVDPH
jgi:hypothetical protein